MVWLDIVVALLLLNSLIAGWREGFFVSAFRCAGVVLAIYLSDLVRRSLTLPAEMSGLSFVIIFVLSLWVAQLLIRLITGGTYGRFGLIDSLLGALISILFTAVMIWIVMQVILYFDPTIEWITRSTTYDYLTDLIGTVAPDLGRLLRPDLPPEPSGGEMTDLSPWR